MNSFIALERLFERSPSRVYLKVLRLIYGSEDCAEHKATPVSCKRGCKKFEFWSFTEPDRNKIQWWQDFVAEKKKFTACSVYSVIVSPTHPMWCCPESSALFGHISVHRRQYGVNSAILVFCAIHCAQCEFQLLSAAVFHEVSHCRWFTATWGE